MSRQFMAEAIRLAAESAVSGLGGPFGAVVVRGGTIVGQGANRVFSQNDPTAHAEVMAIRDAGKALGTFQLTGCELYTSCEPCPMCLGAAYWARLDRIWFASTQADAAAAGFDDSVIYREFEVPIEQRTLNMQNLMRAEAEHVFQRWLAFNDRTHY